MARYAWTIVETSRFGRRTLGYADTAEGAAQVTPLDRPGHRHVVEPPTARLLTRDQTRPGEVVEVERRRSRTRYRGTVVSWTTDHLMLQLRSHRVLVVPSDDVWLVSPVRDR